MDFYSWAENSALESAFSFERFQRYIEWANGQRKEAYMLYATNTALSEALYTPLHILEVALRNSLNDALAGRYGNEWYDAPVLIHGKLREQIDKAKADLLKNSELPTGGKLVAKLTLGFWTDVIGRDYDTLWQTTTHKIIRKPDGKGLSRKEFSRYMNPIRVLRNRIAHHEPILYWDLKKHHDIILMITEWLSSDAAIWSRHHSRFESVWAARPAFMDTLPIK